MLGSMGRAWKASGRFAQDHHVATVLLAMGGSVAAGLGVGYMTGNRGAGALAGAGLGTTIGLSGGWSGLGWGAAGGLIGGLSGAMAGRGLALRNSDRAMRDLNFRHKAGLATPGERVAHPFSGGSLSVPMDYNAASWKADRAKKQAEFARMLGS